jgi:ribosomal protein S18 acetylase RimI-like enzyme
MAPAFTIRPAGAHEVAIVAALFRDYVASLGVDLSYQGIEAELASLPGAYASPSGALLLAVSPLSQPLGCVAMRKLAEDGACEMKRLYAAPSARGMGLGRALALAAIGVATAAGYRSMRLDTLPAMHTAQALYRDLGFEVTTPYYATPIAGTLFMRKTLASL